MEYEIYTLKNGIRLVHKRVDSPVAHCGLIVETGSRDEEKSEHGIAHLIEHLLFKGTNKRRAYHILNRMEDVGSEINAYTTKEETCIHTTFFKDYYPRAIELISDIFNNSVFPEKEIEKEKDVIIDEINSYKDTPSELIFDEFEELAFPGNPLGRNILGEEKCLKKISRGDILKFIQNHYHTNEMVISSVGSISFERLVKITERYFGHLPEKQNTKDRNVKIIYAPFNKTVNKKTYQVHCVLGNIAYDIKDEKRYALHLLNNLLGGPGLSSWLNMSLREKNGYAYNVDSSYNAYRNAGIITIYFGTDKVNLSRCLKIVAKELDRVKNTPLTRKQLIKAQKQLAGHLAISSENNENLMFSIGKSMILFNKVDNLKVMNEKIESVTELQVQEVANEVFSQDKLSGLFYV
ncbi:MAG: pitrilysin family protein [Bacteroidales bacterium]